MFEHEQIEASDRHCLLYAFLKSTSILTLMVIIVLIITMMIKKLLGYTKTVDSVEIAL